MGRIRFATEQDIPGLVEIGRRLHPLTRFREFNFEPERVGKEFIDVLEKGQGRYVLFVAENSEGQIVGRLLGVLEQHIFSSQLVASIVHIDVLPERRIDVLRTASDVSSSQLWFAQKGNNLEVSIIGTADKLVVNNWYLGNQYHLEQFKTGDGKTLLDTQVASLISAMSRFDPPSAGQTSLPASYQATLNPVLAANWK